MSCLKSSHTYANRKLRGTVSFLHWDNQMGIYPSRPDLRDQPLKDPDAVWFTYMMASIKQGTHNRFTWDHRGWCPASSDLSKKAKLIDLLQALHLGKDKRINIYMDSKYEFLLLCAHASIWKHSRLLTTWVFLTQHCQETLELLKAVQ